VGYGSEDAEDKIADNIATLTGSTIGSGAAPAPAPAPPKKSPKSRRQLDKIANSAGAIENAGGVGAATDPVVAAADSADGMSTSATANAGAAVGGTEESTLEQVGSSVPKTRRQLDKIANGAGAIGNAAGVGAATDPVVAAADTVDGTSTSAAAKAGAEIGSTEEQTLEKAGSSVPKP
jgi:hypothetical protein